MGGVIVAAVLLAMIASRILPSGVVGPASDGSLAAGDCGAPYTPISELAGLMPGQGNSSAAGPGGAGTVAGREQLTATEGVLSADFRSGLGGIFLQDGSGRSGAQATSGIFVRVREDSEQAHRALSVGDRLRVAGSVVAYQGAARITDIRFLELCDGQVAIEPIELTLPLDADARREYLGLLVTLPQELTITDNYLLGRFGSLTVAAGGRLYHPNNGNVPGEPYDIRAENEARRLIIDDGSAVQNPVPIPFVAAGATLRSGDSMQPGAVGVMHYGRPGEFDASGPKDFRVHLLDPDAVEFTATNPRPEAPSVGSDEATLTVAAFNVLNYFVSFPGEHPRARGASNEAELERQRAKLVAALMELDADVVGLIEVENEATVQRGVPLGERASAVQHLVDGLNDAYGAEVYRAIPEPAGLGTDAIRQAVIYKPDRVTLKDSRVDDDPVHLRPPLAASFTQTQAPNGAFTLVVAHHKSKRCSEGWEADPETEFEGCFNRLRTAQSHALASFVSGVRAEGPEDNILVVGDLNAYNAEDPIAALVDFGLVNLNLNIPNARRYSFVFAGEAGTLDYAFATPELAEQVTGAALWHINSDEPRLLSYDQVRFGPYERYHDVSPFRSSDHDPILVGIALGSGESEAIEVEPEEEAEDENAG